MLATFNPLDLLDTFLFVDAIVLILLGIYVLAFKPGIKELGKSNAQTGKILLAFSGALYVFSDFKAAVMLITVACFALGFRLVFPKELPKPTDLLPAKRNQNLPPDKARYK